MNDARCNRLSPGIPNLRCTRAEHDDAEECMYTMAAFLQASALMMLDPDSIPDDEMRRMIGDAKDSIGLEPVHDRVLEDVANGSVTYAGATLKRVQ